METYERSFTADMALNNVMMSVKHFTNFVCDDVNCVWNKPHRMEVQWTRPDNQWSVVNALIVWGCYGCTVCTGGTWDNVRTIGPWIPGWQNATTSHNYVFVELGMPALLPFEGNTDRASAEADVYRNGHHQGHMFANPGFNP